MMDIPAIEKELKGFIASHRTAFEELSRRQSQFLEIGALAFAVEHYRKHSYEVHARGLLQGRIFRVKLSSSGSPSDYSWFSCHRGPREHDLYSNLPVSGSYPDAGIYVVDVGVIRSGSLPTRTRGVPFAVSNDNLITFAEVKNFRIYPMLLAHFIGIVHELMPSFLGQRLRYGFARDNHIVPTLFTVGTITPNSADIVRGFRRRKYRVNVIPTFDLEIANMSRDAAAPSPLR